MPVSISKKKIRFFILLFIFFFLPQQFGPHFWPTFSLIQGIRVDYLSPTIYVSDILVFLLFLVSAKEVLLDIRVRHFLKHKYFLAFLFIVIISTLISIQPLAATYGALKLFEFLFFGLYVSTIHKAQVKSIFWIFSITGLLESILAIFEFLKQQSLNSVFYFLGERVITSSTIGAAVVNTSAGTILRPYGTFPHPNILAFYLFISSLFISFLSHHSKNKKVRVLTLIGFIIIQVGLFLTLSRVVILLNILFLLYAFVYLPLTNKDRKIKRYLFVSGLFLCVIVAFLIFNQQRFFSSAALFHDYLPRLDLAGISLQIIQKNALIGTGLHNFYINEAFFQKSFTSVYLQPVHNIFLLTCSELGIVGLYVFVYFIFRTIKTTTKRFRHSLNTYSVNAILFFMLCSIIFVGTFDHFLLTTQQGQFMLAIILSLPYAINSKRN